MEMQVAVADCTKIMLNCPPRVILCISFGQVEASIESGVSVGMKVEVRVQQSALAPYKTYWVASVISACGSLLLLRYGGYDNDRSGDFWSDMATGELHPIGWCARNGRSLRPPDGTGKSISRCTRIRTQLSH